MAACRPEDLNAATFVFEPVEELVLTGTSGNDGLSRWAGDDPFNGGPGRDVYIGNAGADTLVLGAGDRDTAAYFQDGIDTPDISLWAVGSFDQLLVADLGRGRVHVSDRETAAIIRSEDPAFTDGCLTAGDFLSLGMA